LAPDLRRFYVVESSKWGSWRDRALHQATQAAADEDAAACYHVGKATEENRARNDEGCKNKREEDFFVLTADMSGMDEEVKAAHMLYRDGIFQEMGIRRMADSSAANDLEGCAAMSSVADDVEQLSMDDQQPPPYILFNYVSRCNTNCRMV
jgi:hypothetical protein